MAKNPAYPRLPPVDKTALLRRILARCARKPGDVTPVVVFDLDGTLMDNRPRTLAILRDLAHVWKPIHKEPAARLEQASLADLSYLLTDSLARMEITRSDLVAEAEAFWRERFFGDDALAHDVALDGAVEFARACYDAGAILVYLTGRDLPSMGIGSFRSLRDLGFPIGVPGTELVCKPDANMPDEAFKRLESPKLARVGRVVAAFDNEPANANVLLEQNPECDSVFVDTQHLPGAPALAKGVHVIEDFVMT